MTQHMITIGMKVDGDFTYSPSVLHARVGDKVSWTSGHLGPFAVTFMQETPFRRVSLNSTPRIEKGEVREVALPEVRHDHIIAYQEIQKRSIGHHHYAVALAKLNGDDPDAAKVYLDSGCPDIVVSNDGD